jgi:hypothetical protein
MTTARRASIYLGQEREYAMNIRSLVECPFCGGRVKPGLAKCPANGCILNPELAALAGLITMEERDKLLAARKGTAAKKQPWTKAKGVTGSRPTRTSKPTSTPPTAGPRARATTAKARTTS